MLLSSWAHLYFELVPNILKRNLITASGDWCTKTVLAEKHETFYRLIVVLRSPFYLWQSSPKVCIISDDLFLYALEQISQRNVDIFSAGWAEFRCSGLTLLSKPRQQQMAPQCVYSWPLSLADAVSNCSSFFWQQMPSVN